MKLIFSLFFLTALQNILLKKETVSTSHVAVHTTAVTFTDSIKNKADLLISQVQSRISLDRHYFSDGSKFSGDTIYFENSGRPLMILDYSDGLTESYKLLFVFDPGKNKFSDYRIVGKDSDIDESADEYSFVSYKIISGVKFKTITELHRKINKYRKEIIIKNWMIGSTGKITLIKNK